MKFISYLFAVSLFFTQSIYAGEKNHRQELFNALKLHGVLHEDRRLIHVSHVCNIVFKARHYQVIDIKELIGSAVTPRGLSRAVIINDQLLPVYDFEYGVARPLFCFDNKIVMNGDINIENIEPTGNVVVFVGEKIKPSMQSIDIENFPIKPVKETRTLQ